MKKVLVVLLVVLMLFTLTACTSGSKSSSGTSDSETHATSESVTYMSDEIEVMGNVGRMGYTLNIEDGKVVSVNEIYEFSDLAFSQQVYDAYKDDAEKEAKLEGNRIIMVMAESPYIGMEADLVITSLEAGGMKAE